MALRFLCPNCHRELEVPDEAAGTAGSCRLCGAAIIAPSAPGQPAAMAQAPGAPPPGGPSGAPVAQAPYGRVEPLGILSESWNLLWANFGPIAIAYYVPGIIAFIVIMLIVGPMMLPNFSAMSSGDAQQPPVYVNFLIPLLIAALSPLLVGSLYVVVDILTRGQAEASAMFRGLRQYKDIVIVALVVYTAPNLLQVLFAGGAEPGQGGRFLISMLLGLVLNGLFAAAFLPAIVEVVDRGTDGITALRTSWEITAGHRASVFFAFVVLYLASAAGVVACGVGALVTSLLLPPGIVLIYRDLRGLRGGTEGTAAGPYAGGPANPPARGGGAPWALLAVGGCAVMVIPILAAILFPVFAKARERAKTTACMNGMKLEYIALTQYAGAHGGRLPNAARWEDDTKRFLPAGSTGCPDVKTGSGYMFNAALSGQPMPTGPAASTTVVLFEGGNGGRNQAGSVVTAAPRHGRNVSVVYADGRVSMMPPGTLPAPIPLPGGP